MAYTSVVIVAALAVVALADPLRYKRSTETIQSSGGLVGEGAGQAHNNHAELLLAVGAPGVPGGWSSGSGWGAEGQPIPAVDAVPASIVVSSTGGSFTGQNGDIIELSSNDGQHNLSGVQSIGVQQASVGSNELGAAVHGIEAAVAQTSASDASGAAASGAAGNLAISSN